MGPLPTDNFGFSFVIVVIDAFTRYSELFPAVNVTAVEAARALLNCLDDMVLRKRYGVIVVHNLITS